MSKQKEINKAIRHLMDWSERPEWADDKFAIYERNVEAAAERMEMQADVLVQMLQEAGLLEMLMLFCFEDLATYRSSADGRNLIDDFLKRRGWREGVHGRRYLRQLGEAVLSLYEVQAVAPGRYCDVIDLVRGGKPVRVYEVTGTQQLARWDRLSARVLPGNGKAMFSGSILPLSGESSEILLSILNDTEAGMQATISKLDVDADLKETVAATSKNNFLEYAVPAFSLVWMTEVVKQLEAPFPEIRNRDGDVFIFAETQFKFEPQQQQKIITLLDGADGWERHSDKDLYWDWLPEGKADAGIIHGFVDIKGNSLSLSTNSNSRYEKGSRLLAELLDGLIGPPLTSIQSPEQLMTEQKLAGERSAPADLDLNPEQMAEMMTDYFDQHYRQILEENIPALGDKTPRECVKTKQGREKVISWLKYLENQEAHRAKQDGGSAYDFSWMWAELGLD